MTSNSTITLEAPVEENYSNDTAVTIIDGLLEEASSTTFVRSEVLESGLALAKDYDLRDDSSDIDALFTSVQSAAFQDGDRRMSVADNRLVDRLLDIRNALTSWEPPEADSLV